MELELSGATQRYSVAMAMVLLIAGVAIGPTRHQRHIFDTSVERRPAAPTQG